METVYKLNVPNRLENLALIGEFLEKSMKAHDIDDCRIYEISTAVDEAAANVILYGFPDGRQEDVEIACTVSESSITVSIKDTGGPYDPTSAPAPDLSDDIENRHVGGLGVHFMKELMDEIGYEYKDNTETLTMVKYL